MAKPGAALSLAECVARQGAAPSLNQPVRDAREHRTRSARRVVLSRMAHAPVFVRTIAGVHAGARTVIVRPNGSMVDGATKGAADPESLNMVSPIIPRESGDAPPIHRTTCRCSISESSEMENGFEMLAVKPCSVGFLIAELSA